MKKFLLSFLVMFVSIVFANAMDTVYVHEFTAQPTFSGTGRANGDTAMLSGAKWTILDDLTYVGFDTQATAKGWQIGKSKAPQPSFSVSVSGIKQQANVVLVTVSGASGADFDFTVSLNNLQMSPAKVTCTETTPNEHEFTALATSGEIKLSFTNRGKAIYIKKLVVGYETPATVEAPVFSVEEGVFFNPTKVALSTLTEDAAIYYTLDGTEPTAASTLYTDSILVSATTTIKAIAVKGEDNSEVVSATYTFPEEVADIAAFLARADKTNPVFIASDLTVIYQDNARIFVKDNSGYLLIYGSIGYNDLVNGDVLSRMCGTYEIYNGIHEFIPVKGYTIAEPTHGTEATPETRTVATVTVDDVNAYVALKGVLPTEAVTFEEGTQTNITLKDNAEAETTIVARSAFKQIAGAFEANVAVDVVGIVTIYNENPQISIISIAKTPVETKVDNAALDAAIYTNDNNIFVETEAGNTIEVYNVQGQMLVSTVANEGLNTIAGVPAGVVIVRVNGVAHKVVL